MQWWSGDTVRVTLPNLSNNCGMLIICLFFVQAAIVNSQTLEEVARLEKVIVIL